MPIDPPTRPVFPTRYAALAARGRYGDRVDRLGAQLWRGDELADAAVSTLVPGPDGDALIGRALDGERDGVPEPLRALVAEARRVPVWLDWARVERGARAFLRTGMLGGIVLGARAIILGYASPAGNKPLVLSGRLREAAAGRLHETSRFVRAVVQPEGLRPGAEGWRVTLRVRLMHAQVRRMILASGRWRSDDWGLPINQHDMVATTLLFSAVTLGGLRALGVEIDRDESDDFMHLWRWVGEVIGVDPSLLPATEAEAIEIGQLILATQGAPDDDSRALTRALLEHGLAHPDERERTRARKSLGLARALCRHLVGDPLADELDVPRTRERYFLPAAIGAVRALEQARKRSRRLDRALARQGRAYWDLVIRKGLVLATTDFALPTRLGNA